MRWALALQEFSLTFKYRAGRNNAAADCLSRLNFDDSQAEYLDGTNCTILLCNRIFVLRLPYVCKLMLCKIEFLFNLRKSCV